MPTAPTVPQLVPATPEQEPVLANLLELYIHDFSAFLDVEVREDGRFGYDPLPLYWTEPHRHPFLIEIGSKLAGFVLVKKGSELSGSPNVWDMVEFFVLRRYRRQGYGTRTAHQVWTRFPGVWEVRVMQANEPACHFWARAASSFRGQTVQPIEFERNGALWNVFSFDSSRS